MEDRRLFEEQGVRDWQSNVGVKVQRDGATQRREQNLQDWSTASHEWVKHLWGCSTAHTFGHERDWP
jgi:hypothetical protein